MTFTGFATVAAFTTADQTAYKTTIIDASNATSVNITSITLGSINVATVAYFTSANSAGATSLVKTLSSNASSIFSSTIYGNATASGITESSVSGEFKCVHVVQIVQNKPKFSLFAGAGFMTISASALAFAVALLVALFQ